MSRTEFPDNSHHSLGAAVAHVARLARTIQVAHVVCVRVEKNTPRFAGMLAESYKLIKDRGTADDMAVVCTILPSGKLEAAPEFRDARLFPPLEV